MKKIIIALAISVGAIYAEAASVKWNSGTIYVASVATGTLGTANLTQAVADGSGENPQTGYGVVLYVDTATSAKYDDVDAFVKSYVGTATWQDTTGSTLGNLAMQQANWTAIGGAVPEPTSGMLLLLGLSRLALRRKKI